MHATMSDTSESHEWEIQPKRKGTKRNYAEESSSESDHAITVLKAKKKKMAEEQRRR